MSAKRESPAMRLFFCKIRPISSAITCFLVAVAEVLFNACAHPHNNSSAPSPPTTLPAYSADSTQTTILDFEQPNPPVVLIPHSVSTTVPATDPASTTQPNI